VSLRGQLRVIVVDDDSFTVSLVAAGLESQGFAVFPATSIPEAWSALEARDPHVLVTDLDLGSGASGLALAADVRRVFPWMGIVVLTAHRSPLLAVEDSARLPENTVYLVKSSIRRVEELAEAVQNALAAPAAPHRPTRRGTLAVEAAHPGDEVRVVTPSQAEVLRMLANGATTRALAERRGTTIRAAETMLSRLFESLGLNCDDRTNPRVEAIRLWQRGRVIVR
jgi:DNA-binding NarL/FixJ family response regulator